MQEIKNYLQSKKNLVSLITLVFLLLAIPLGIYLATRVQIFFPKAVEGIISLAEGNCVTTINGEKVLTCKDVPLKLIMPFGSPSPSPSGSSIASASPTSSPSVSPSASTSASPAACNPKKFDANTWAKKLETCKKKKQRVIYSCQDKTKTKKQKCGADSGGGSTLEQSPYNGPHNIPGKIEAEDFDNGGEDVAYHDTKVKGKQSRPYRDSEHVDIARTNDPLDKKGYDVTSLNGEWLEYTLEVSQSGSYIIETRAQGGTSGVFHIEIDGVDKSGHLTIPAAKSGKDWSIVKSPAIDLTEGQIIIRVVMDDGKGDNLVGGFNYFEFKNAPTANLLQRVRNSLVNSVFAKSDDDNDKDDNDPNGNSEASKSAKTKCTKKMKKKGLCPVGTEQNCADKKDNDGDGKIDKDDPECHTDGDPDNKKSYDRKRNEAPLTECKDGKDNDSDGLIDSADPGCHSDGNGQNSASYDPGLDDESRQMIGSPSPTPGDILNVSYRLAETEAGLASATFTAFTQNPTVTTFTLSDETPGTKQIWVEFKNNLTGETVIEHITVNLIDINPRVASADCTLDLNKRSLKVTINGSNLGQNRGKLLSDDEELNILDWRDNVVVGLLDDPGISVDDGESFEFDLTRSDGVELEDTIFCRVDTSTIALGARVFCRDQGKFDVPNVKVTLKDQNNNSIEEKVTITKEGLVSGLKTKLQSGKQYILSIKAPNSLRRNTIFTAGVGTTFVSQTNGAPFILPVGDIAPPILPDGKINTLDRSEIVRQWSVLGKGTDDTGDFNKDKRINSIDWACMRYDFNQEDEVIPDASTLIPSPTPTPTPLPSSTSLTSPSPSPASSSQRAAYFLPEAEGGGTYAVNSEFGVNVNLWSQNEAANLFSAKMSFNPQVLEVVRIDKGSTLTNWTDSSFDNLLGKVSLIAGIPSPGLITTEGNNPLMGKIMFKGKQVGNTTITMSSDSAIYSNADNTNIISALISTPVVITQ